MPPNVETSWDQKVLNIIPMVSIKGDENVQESLVTFMEDNVSKISKGEIKYLIIFMLNNNAGLLKK